jgi:hypothetical protein
MIHGKKEGVDKLVLSFHEQHGHISKAQIKKRILEISEKGKHSDGYGTSRFLVKAELLSTHCPELVSQEIFFTPIKKKSKRVSEGGVSNSIDDQPLASKQPRVDVLTGSPQRSIVSLFQGVASSQEKSDVKSPATPEKVNCSK